jgi:hypothetical protein
MISPRSISAAMFCVLTACAKPTPIVVIDTWWNVDYAKGVCASAEAATFEARRDSKLIEQFGCDAITSCQIAQEVQPVIAACDSDPAISVRIFERDLATEFASNSTCASVKIVALAKVKASTLGDDHWQLMLDFSPGRSEQQWGLERGGKKLGQGSAQGRGGPREIARMVCNIVKGRGATVDN